MVWSPRGAWLLTATWLALPGAFAAELPPEPTEAQVRAEYDATRDAWTSRYADEHEYDVRHILVASEAEAKAVLERIAGGEKFEDLARSLSKDAASGAKGGSLGWSLPVYYVQPFADGMKQLRPMGMSREPVRTVFGWHVIQVLGIRKPVFPAYEELEDRVRSTLRQHWLEYDQSSIFTREVEQRSIVNRGEKTFFQYRERVTFGAQPERRARAIQAVVDCGRKERADLAPDGSFEMRTIYEGTAQDRQMRLVCERAGHMASAAQAAARADSSVDADLGCDAPSPRQPAGTGQERSFPGATVVVRGEVTAPAGAIGAVFVDVPSGFASIDNAAVRAFQAMQCKPRTALQASQWMQRSFVFPAAGVAHIRQLPAVDASPGQAGGASAPAPQRPDGTPAPRPRR